MTDYLTVIEVLAIHDGQIGRYPKITMAGQTISLPGALEEHDLYCVENGQVTMSCDPGGS